MSQQFLSILFLISSNHLGVSKTNPFALAFRRSPAPKALVLIIFNEQVIMACSGATKVLSYKQLSLFEICWAKI